MNDLFNPDEVMATKAVAPAPSTDGPIIGEDGPIENSMPDVAMEIPMPEPPDDGMIPVTIRVPRTAQCAFINYVALNEQGGMYMGVTSLSTDEIQNGVMNPWVEQSK